MNNNATITVETTSDFTDKYENLLVDIREGKIISNDEARKCMHDILFNFNFLEELVKQTKSLSLSGDDFIAYKNSLIEDLVNEFKNFLNDNYKGFLGEENLNTFSLAYAEEIDDIITEANKLAA